MLQALCVRSRTEASQQRTLGPKAKIRTSGPDEKVREGRDEGVWGMRRNWLASVAAGALAVLAPVAIATGQEGVAPASEPWTDVPACDSVFFGPGNAARILLPTAAPARTPNPVVVAIGVAPPSEWGMWSRVDFWSALTDADGEILTTAGLDEYTRAPRKEYDSAALYSSAVGPFLNPPGSYALKVKELWQWGDSRCQSSSERTFVAGGAIGAKGTARVSAKVLLKSEYGSFKTRGVRETVTGSSALAAQMRVDVTARCPVVSDGYGNAVTIPQTIAVRFPSVTRTPVQRWQVCDEGATRRQVGSSFTEKKTFTSKRMIKMAVGQPATKRWPWTVSIEGRGVVVKGSAVAQRTAYTPARSWRIWDYEIDRFVNVCINQTYRLWSSGGRLYCEDTVLRKAHIQISATATRAR